MLYVSRAIREIRKNLNLTQAEFAQAIGASQGSVSKWETGKEAPRLEAIMAISELTDRPFDMVRLLTARQTVYRPKEETQTVEMVGSIQPGYLYESPYFDETNRFPMELPLFGVWKKANIQSWNIDTDAYDVIYPGNSLIFTIVIDVKDSVTAGAIAPSVLRSGDIIVASIPKAGFYEVVIRRFERYEDGSTALAMPDFSKEARRPPLPFSTDVDDPTQPTLLGLAVGTFSLHISEHHEDAISPE